MAGLIDELRSFEDQGLEVRLSLDGGITSLPISIVAKRGGKALLINCQDEPTPIHHHEET